MSSTIDDDWEMKKRLIPEFTQEDWYEYENWINSHYQDIYPIPEIKGDENA